MKKTIGILVAILCCVALVVPVLGAVTEFVPSITYKGYPDLVEALDADEVDLKGKGCIRIVPLSELEKLTDEEAELMETLYEKLCDGTMELPYDEVENIDPEKMVVREFLHISVVCDEEHKEPYLVTLDLGVEADDVLTAMTYVEDESSDELDGEWIPCLEVTNNGDGTVTFKLEHLGPVAISIQA